MLIAKNALTCFPSGKFSTYLLASQFEVVMVAARTILQVEGKKCDQECTHSVTVPPDEVTAVEARLVLAWVAGALQLELLQRVQPITAGLLLTLGGRLVHL